MPNDIVQSFSKQYKKSTQDIEKAWDYAETQAKDKYSPTDEEYYPYVTSMVKQMIGGNLSMQEAVSESESFSWNAGSTQQKAVCWGLVGQDTFEFTFRLFNPDSTYLPIDQRIIRDTEISRLLVVTIDQIDSADLDTVHLSNTMSMISPSNIEPLKLLAAKVIKDYLSKFSAKNVFSHMMLYTASPQKIKLFDQYLEYFAKQCPSLSKDCDLCAKLSDESKKYPKPIPYVYFVLKNSSGPSLKKKKVEEQAHTGESNAIAKVKQAAPTATKFWAVPDAELKDTWLVFYYQKHIRHTNLPHIGAIAVHNNKLHRVDNVLQLARLYGPTPVRKLAKAQEAVLAEDEGTVSSGAFDAAPFDAKRTRDDWKQDWESQINV